MCLLLSQQYHIYKISQQFVRGRGLEPPWITPLAPKASASAISPPAHLIILRVRPHGFEPWTHRLRGGCSTN